MNIKYIITSILFTALPGRVIAAPSDIERLQKLDPTIAGKVAAGSGSFDIFTVINSLIERLPFFLTAFAFAAFLFSGGMYVLAMGDATKMESAKKNMGWAAIGMVAMASVYIIIKIAAAVGNSTKFITDYQSIPGITQ